MKWFLGLSEYTTTFNAYSEMVKVAIISALKNTKLEPYFIFNGSSQNNLVEWLVKKNVKIIFRKSFLEEILKDSAEKNHDNNIYTIGSGAFLRLEIPDILKEFKMNDKYILYTDCDVMFLYDVADDFEKMKPKYFSVAPELEFDNCNKINTGVMLMNIKNLQKVDKDFKNYVLNNIENLIKNAWDQTAYINYYSINIGNIVLHKKWDNLPQRYNFKPYWGDYCDAKIIHFHDLKPFLKEALGAKQLPEILLKMETKEYHQLCDIFYKYLNIN